MKLPVALQKQSGDDVHFDQDWTSELEAIGIRNAAIVQSNWSVEFGTVVLAATRPNSVNGLITTTHVSSGAGGEHFVLNNSIILDTTDILVQRFAGVIEVSGHISDLPALIKAVGDNVPFTYDWATTIANLNLECASITSSSWAVVFGAVLLNADARPDTLDGTVAGTFVSSGQSGQNSIISNSVTIVAGDDTVLRTKLFKIQVIAGDFVT